MEWIKVTDRLPSESDNLILVAVEGKALIEMVWVSDEEGRLKKPFAYDEHDTPVFSLNEITHWMPLPNPPQE